MKDRHSEVDRRFRSSRASASPFGSRIRCSKCLMRYLKDSDRVLSAAQPFLEFIEKAGCADRKQEKNFTSRPPGCDQVSFQAKIIASRAIPASVQGGCRPPGISFQHLQGAPAVSSPWIREIDRRNPQFPPDQFARFSQLVEALLRRTLRKVHMLVRMPSDFMPRFHPPGELLPVHSWATAFGTVDLSLDHIIRRQI